MSCNPNRACNDTSPGMDWYTAAAKSPECTQFFDPGNFQAEQVVYDAAYKDMINSFGIPVEYYINTFNLSAANTLYGEQPTAIFYGPISLMMYIELVESPISFSKFGLATDDELTGYIHITTFEEEMVGKSFYIQTSSGTILKYDEYIASQQTSPEDIFKAQTFKTYVDNGQVVEPKSGDLIQVSPLGCDRPNSRGAKVFEITERVDQDIAAINPLMGHYIYRVRGKRYEYSFEPGAPLELVNDQVFESEFSGITSTLIPGQSASAPKLYSTDVNVDSKADVLDMSVNNTDIYGAYY